MNIGFSFSGGGVRGAAHLGVAQALYESGIRPKIFTGASSGAIVATLLALGYSPTQAYERFKKTNNIIDIAYWYIISRLVSRKDIQGVLKGKKLRKALDEAFSKKILEDVMTFDDIFEGSGRLAVVSTDIKRGKQIIFTNSRICDSDCIIDHNFEVIHDTASFLSDIVMSSCLIPGLFIPKERGDLLLVDGGLVNNLPSDIAFSLGADRVISMDLGYTGMLEEVGGLYSVLKQSLDVMMKRGVDANKEYHDIYLNPKIYDVKVLDTSRIDECFWRGYEYGVGVADYVLSNLSDGKK